MRVNRTLGMLLCAFSLTLGCGDGGPSPLGMSISVYGPSGTDPFAGVGLVRVYAEENGAAISTPQTTPYSGIPGELAVDDIPYGSGRQVVVEGWSVGPDGGPGALISRGKSVRADVAEGDAGEAFNVMVCPVNAFSPLTDSLTRMMTTLTYGRVGHTVTKTDRGEILVAGGGTFSNPAAVWWRPDAYETYLPSVELIKEGTGSNQMLPTTMFFGRIWHSATALPTGQVLLAGGYADHNGQAATDRVEVYNPGAGTEPPTVLVLQNYLSTKRWGHTATLIDPESFTVLIVGGDEDVMGQGTYELWNPYSGTLKSGVLPDNSMRRHHQATLFEIPDRGKAVLITGGETASGLLDSVLIYDVVTDTMLVSPLKLAAPVTQHTATWVPGRNYIYVVGGFTSLDRQSASAAIDVYDTVNNTIFSQPGFSLTSPRGGHSASLGVNNSVIYAGGSTTGNVALNSLEIIYEYLDPALNKFRIEVAQSSAGGIPYLTDPRFGQKAVYLDAGTVLFVGGMTNAGVLPQDLTVYNPL